MVVKTSIIKHKVDIKIIEPKISSHNVTGLTNSRNMKVLLEVFWSDRDFIGTVIGYYARMVVGKNEVSIKLINEFRVVCIVVDNDRHENGIYE